MKSQFQFVELRKSELTELKARDASCPKGKKMERRNSLTNRNFEEAINLKIVTICGSMKFENEMKKVAFILETKHDMCVLQCVYNEDNLELGEDEIITLNLAHLKKIELADAIYVVDLQGYIGEQVKKEITFAQNLGKEVIFHTEFFVNR